MIHIPYIQGLFDPIVPMTTHEIHTVRRFLRPHLNGKLPTNPHNPIISLTVHTAYKPDLTAITHNLTKAITTDPALKLNEPVTILASWQKDRQPPSISLQILDPEDITKALEILPTPR